MISPSKPPYIVIVDDDEAVSKNLYQLLLEEAGYRVSVVKDGFLGLELLKGGDVFPDLLLVDCSMPKMDGETFLRKLKEEIPEIFFKTKIVGFTCYDLNSPAFQRIKSLAYDCREKPSTIQGVLDLAYAYTAPTEIAGLGR